ncbi:response regulator transcription factor [Paenibacillus cymbidii]|uniref:response regulator transcription factor n=1 Tax=Paenibacillus cymbidii TaxID=1639034 RepID=UPI0010822FAA|nr:response regulator transcription factor [Paenibacillus cymbidii]
MNKPVRVFVAEDLDVLRNYYSQLIVKQPDMVLAGQASSGKRTLEMAEANEVDVVLMDIEMDYKHDGIMTALALFRMHPGIKIIFLTVHEDDETVFRAFETDAVDYITKTASDEEIVRSIRRAHEGISQIRPAIAGKVKGEFTRIRRNEEILFQAMLLLTQLTRTEMDILDLLLKEHKVAEIAQIRQVEMSTLKSQINIILKKFDRRRTKEVVALLRDLNLEPLIQKVRGC